jgi:hypothetical protein
MKLIMRSSSCGAMSQEGAFTMTQIMSEEHVAAVTPAAPKQWQFKNIATVNSALTFANSQHLHAGEISAVARNDGTVGMFYFQ